MKPEKFEALKEAVEEMIAENDYHTRHHLYDSEIVKRLSDVYKKKHILKAIKEVR